MRNIFILSVLAFSLFSVPHAESQVVSAGIAAKNSSSKLDGKFTVIGYWNAFFSWQLEFKNGELAKASFDNSHAVPLQTGGNLKVSQSGPLLSVNYYEGDGSDTHMVYGLMLSVVEDGGQSTLKLLQAYELMQDAKGEFAADDPDKVSFKVVSAVLHAGPR